MKYRKKVIMTDEMEYDDFELDFATCLRMMEGKPYDQAVKMAKQDILEMKE